MTIEEFLAADVSVRNKPWRKLLFFAISAEIGKIVSDPGPNPSSGQEHRFMWEWIRKRIPDARLNELLDDLSWARR
jgi:hypothetical protein